MNFKETVLTHLKMKEFNGLKKILNGANALDIINIISELSNEDLVIAYRLLDKDLALEVFEGLSLGGQQGLISSLTEKDAIWVFKKLAPDARVRLLDELPAAVAKRMLASLNKEDRDDVNLLMGFEAQTAGRLMTPEYVRLRKEWRVEEALDKLSEIAKEKETIYTLYVTDEKRKLEGVITLRELLAADKQVSISEIMDSNAVSFHTGVDQEEVAKSLQKLDLLAVPIVDKEDRLVGIITVDDAMDILEDEANEDIFNKAGITDFSKKESARSDVLVNGSVGRIWKVRMPFLILTLIMGMVAGFVIEGFEEILESSVIIAFFIPVIMDMGGNIGIQSSTVFLRGTIVGHITPANLWKKLFREGFVGSTMAIGCGLLAGVGSYFWQGNIRLSMAVGLSLALTMILSTFLGYLVPWFLVKINVDQAAGTDPIITGIKDITGLLIYFGLIMAFVGAVEPDYEVVEAIVIKDGVHYHLDLEEETAIVVGFKDGYYDVEIPDEIEVMDGDFEVIGESVNE